MTKKSKIFLGVGCGVLFLGAVVVAVGGYFAMNYLGKYVEQAETFVAEGREFGKTTDQDGCIAEGVQRSRANKMMDFVAGINNASFVDGCLETSRKTPSFCDGVPSLLSPDANPWGEMDCRKRGADPQKTGCVHVLKRKHQYCNKLF